VMFRLFMLLIAVSGFSYASDFSSANQSGKDFANSINNSSLNNLAKDIDPNDIPGYQGINVDAKQYYGDAGIEDKARAKSLSDPTAQFMNDARVNQPDFNISRQNDPLFKRYDEVTELSHGLSDSYSGCIDLPVGTADVTKHLTKYCDVNYHQDTINFDCDRAANVNCSNPNAGQPNPYTKSSFIVSGDAGMTFNTSNNIIFTYGSERKNRHGDCKDFNNTIKFWISDVNDITEFKLLETKYDDWLFIWVNNNVAFQAIGSSATIGLDKGWAYPGTYTCEKRGIHRKSFNVDAKSRLRNGWNYISIRHKVGGGGNAWMKFRIRRNHGCTKKTTYTWSCPSGESHLSGTYKSSQCVQGASTKYVKGFPFYRSCWKRKYSYFRLSAPYPVRDPECGKHVASGCGQIGTTCVSHNGNFCVKEQLKYSCPYTDSARHVSMCGDQMVCPDGGCTSEYGQTYQPQTQEFKEAATGMAVAESIASEINHDNLTVFSGKVLKCSKRSYGAGNCCKDSGWGLDAGLNSCSSEEKELGLAKQANQTHYVDNYCNDRDDILGCLSRKYYHCKFPSKLARIIVEQGYPQLGKGWGNRHAPNCDGFTTEEIERLDFNLMDLSEFYADVEQDAANGSVPNAGNLANELKNKIKNMFPEVKE
jgi:conjugal transfer mating pair stabilization protein TraN